MMLARFVLLGCAQLVPLMLAAQAVRPREPLKEGQPPPASSTPCPSAVDPPSPTDEQRRRARDLAQRALQAALLGDSATARDELRQAAALDRTDADLAYRLGRAHETVRASADAVSEYCRFLTLAPSAPEAADVRARVSALASPATDPRAAAGRSTFQGGVDAYESGRMADAEAAFSATIRQEPQWAEPYYNRAMTSLARGANEAAVRDLEQFLRLKPETDDRAAIVARIALLRRVTFSPSTALTAGLALPGAGQYYTRRPLRGGITSLGAGAALAVALLQRTTTSTVEQTGIDPFGNEYTYTTTRQSRERPYLVAASAVAVAISVGSAIDAFRYAQRTLR
jgi:tetratricopeptide (TPR) repeat protein